MTCSVRTAVAIAAAAALATGCNRPKNCEPSQDLCADKWGTPLPLLQAYLPGTNPNYPGADYYEIHVTQFQQWFGFYSKGTSRRLYTTVWGYGQIGQRYDVGVRDSGDQPVPQSGMYVAPMFRAERGKPVVVKWIDDRRNPDGSPQRVHLLESAYDTTVHGAANGEPHVRMVTHLHGGETAPDSDGFPEFWFTPDSTASANGLGGPSGNFAVYTYPNLQPSAALWYHDHSFGITRLNVMAIGAGFYFLRDPAEEAALNLPSGPHEIPLLIADRSFKADGSISYLNEANAPATPYHPRLTPEFFGDVITVNGMAWPFLNVEPRKYRFPILNASNSRMYNLRLVDLATRQLWGKVWQVGSDGGYLTAPVRLDMTPTAKDDATDGSRKLFLAPAERADVVVDFSGLTPGATLLLTNDAPAPFPDADPPDAGTTGQVLLFRVVPLTAPDESSLPAQLNPLPTRIDASQVSVVRHMVLTEVEDPVTGDPVAGLINNTCWDAPITENPRLGATEIWEIADATPDTHPIHIHLVQFNLLDRQVFDRDGYLASWNAASPNGGGLPAPVPTCPAMVDPVNPPGVATWPQTIPAADAFLRGLPIPPADNEAGWKDTVRVKKDTVTRFLVRFAPRDPSQQGPYGGFQFDPTNGKYVWHCHILEHEDNDMMRPYQLSRP